MMRPATGYWKMAALVMLALLAVVPRVILLGERPAMHDEAQDAWYSYAFARDGHYTHNPILHGPSLILAAGLVFRWAGDSMTAARAVVAVISIIGLWVGLQLWPRRYRYWLAPLLLSSPMLLYFSRFYRNDMVFSALVLIGLVGIVRSLEGRSPAARAAWGTLAPVPLLALLALKMNAPFIYAAGLTWVLAWLIMRLFWRRPALWLRPRRMVRPISSRPARPAARRDRRETGRRKEQLRQPGRPLPAALPSPIPGRAMRATLAGWALGSVIGMAYVLFIYGVTTPDYTFSPLANIARTIEYWAGQHQAQRITGALHYHLPILLTYELPILLLLAAGLVVDAAGRPARTLVYLGSILAWIALWMIWGAIELRGPLARVVDFLHMEPSRSMLVLGLWIVPLLAWSVLALKEHRLLGSWLAWWAASSLFQYSVAGEKVPWLGLHIALPLILTLGWVWAPWLRRAGPSGRQLAVAALAVATLIALRNDYYLVGPRAADPAERLVYNHTSVEYDALCRDYLLSWQRRADEVPLAARRVALSGETGWPGVWYFRHCGYDLPAQPPDAAEGWDLITGIASEMEALCAQVDPARWRCTPLSMRDHWWAPWPEQHPWLAWWRYYWWRIPWTEPGGFYITAVEPLGP